MINEPLAGIEEIPGITDDPIFRLLYTGQAQTLSEAEEMYLTASLDHIGRLFDPARSEEDIMREPPRTSWTCSKE